MKEKKLRIEDALSATKAAVEEGLVAGGGVALITASAVLDPMLAAAEGDEKTGIQIVLKALEEPVRQIALNAGLEGGVIIDKIRSAGKVNYGFDFAKEGVCGYVHGRYCRPHQGHPVCSAERGFRRGHGADHRIPGGRQERARPGGSGCAGGMDGMY